jgi:hypothetical protein
MADGDTCFYGAKDSTGAWETGIGTLSVGAIIVLERTTIIRSSSGAGVKYNWSDDSAKELCGVLPASVFENLIADVGIGPGSTGMIVRTGDWTWTNRSFIGGSKLTIADPIGSSGDIEIDDSIFLDYLRGTGGSDAERTATAELFFQAEVNLNAVKTIISGFDGSNNHTLYITDPTEEIGRINRVSASDYDLYLNEAGGEEKVLVETDLGATIPAEWIYPEFDVECFQDFTSGSPPYVEYIIGWAWPSTPTSGQLYRVSMYVVIHLAVTPLVGDYIWLQMYGFPGSVKIWESEAIDCWSLAGGTPDPVHAQIAYPVPSFLVDGFAFPNGVSIEGEKSRADMLYYVSGGEPSSLSYDANPATREIMGPYDPGLGDNSHRFSWAFVAEEPLGTKAGF